MTFHDRLPAWVASAALACLLFAPQALAGDVASAVCGGDPDSAPSQIEAAYVGYDTSALDAGQCAIACQVVRKACEDLAKNITACHSDQNKRQTNVDVVLCGDSDCKTTAKDAKKSDNTAAKNLAKGAMDLCEGLEADCADNCVNLGTFFPLPS